MKHGINEAKVLNRLGYPVSSPIMHYYDWPKIKGKYAPYQHQKECAAFLTLHRKCFNLSTMGTGKSAAALYAVDYLRSVGLINRVLIVSPLSCMESVWAEEIFNLLPGNDYAILHGASSKRKAMLSKEQDFYILNHDGIKILKDELVKRKDIDTIIVDEASMFRNHDTGLFKTLSGLVRPDQHLWLLTGTPTPNAPTDAWALAKLVNPDNVPKYFGTWKRQTMIQISQFKWVPQKFAHKMVHEALQPAIRFRKEDCIDLPPVTFQKRKAELTKDQKQHYDSMRDNFIMQSDLADITAVNAADRILKLRQILCGVIKNPEADEYIPLDAKSRLNTLMECISETDSKVIVFVPFTGALRLITNHIRSNKLTCEFVDGSVSKNARTRIFSDFQNERDPRVLVAHPRTTSHGLTLTAADTIIWYAPYHSADAVQQANDRINRIGQDKPMTVIQMGSSPLEWKMYAALEEKQSMQALMLDLYKEEVVK